MTLAGPMRIAPPAPASLRGGVVAALLLSAAGHAGALLWFLSGEPAREIAATAGGTVAIEVALIQGPAGDAAGSRDLPAPPADETPAATADPAPVPSAPPDGVRQTADRATNADRVVEAGAVPPSQADAPRRIVKVPIPPPKPPAPAAEPAGGTVSDIAAIAPRNDSADAAGRTQGAAPRADNPAPAYPAIARRRGHEGRLVLRVDVLPSGQAGRVVIERSSGFASLDSAAADAVRRWRFDPARRNGRPVPALIRIPIRFVLK